MSTKLTSLAGVAVAIALGLICAGASLAQTTTTVDVRDFEVISVEGSTLVVRDQKGTNEYTVPDDFRFTVDGKKMAVSELKPGMKGTATITTTTTVKPVVITEVKEAEVVRASDLSVTVREGNNTRRYTKGELTRKGVLILKDGQAIHLEDLKRGDKLTATIVTHGPPVVLTEQEVQATLAEPAPAAAPTQVAAASGAAPSAAPSAAPAPAAAPAAAPPAPAPAQSAGMGPLWWVLLAALAALVVYVIARRRKEQ